MPVIPYEPPKAEIVSEIKGDLTPEPQEIMETLPGGGKAHKLSLDFTLFPDNALVCMVKILSENVESHGRENWKKLPLHVIDKHDINHYYERRTAEQNPHHTAQDLIKAQAHHAMRAVMGLSVLLDHVKCDCE